MNTPQDQGDADPDIPAQGNDPEVGRVETVNPEEEDSEEYEVYTGIPIRELPQQEPQTQQQPPEHPQVRRPDPVDVNIRTTTDTETREDGDMTLGFGRDLSLIQHDLATDITSPAKPRVRSGPLAPLIVSTPRRKGLRDLVSSAMRQSMGKGHYTPDDDKDLPEDEDISTMELKTEGDRFIIGGRPVTLRAQPRSEEDCGAVRLWDKTKRSKLTAEARIAFDRAATGYVLPKGNKLTVPSVVTKDEQLIAEVDNLQIQIKMLSKHMASYDIDDVMTIVVPIDVRSSQRLEECYYNLFHDYSKLHPEIVANSCTWYNRWVDESYIRENMALTLDLLHNNTDPVLWAKCAESYDEYLPIQQGGPLMLCLILQRIQNHSEQVLDLLKTQISRLTLRSLQGEDVEQAVRLIKSTHRVLKNASTSYRSYLPIDFTKSVYTVFQTSSVPEFNDTFRDLARKIQTEADMAGVQPRWPPVTDVCRLATTIYKRLKTQGTWDGLVGTKKNGAYYSGGQSGSSNSLNKTCWNCGSPDHTFDKANPNKCTKPFNKQRYDANKKKFYDQRPSNRGNGGRGRSQQSQGNQGRNPQAHSNAVNSTESTTETALPHHKTSEDGLPLILNKNNVYVVDQKKYKALVARFKGTIPAEDKTPSANVAQSSETTTDTTDDTPHVTFQSDKIRSALRHNRFLE